MLSYLQTFNAVAQYGTFAAAGDRIGLTQSAVSVQMRKLEAALGFAVFDRTGRKAVINDAGKRVLAHAQQVALLLGQMKTGVTDAQLHGSMRVGSITTSLLGDIPHALQNFHQRFAQVGVSLVPGMSMELLAMVEARRLDCALIVKPNYPLEGVLRWQPLRQEPFVLITPEREMSSHVEQLLAQHAFIRYERQSHGGSLVDRFLKRHKYKVRDAVEIDSIETMVLLVSRGLGVAIIPRTPALAMLKHSVREVGLNDGTFYRTVGLVSRSDCPQMHLNTDFFNSLLSASSAALGVVDGRR